MRNLLVILSVLCFALIKNAYAWNCPYGWELTDFGCRAYGNYGRGTGFAWKFGDGTNLKGAKRRCENKNEQTGCSKYGEMYYPKCIDGFQNNGCCVCQFDNYDIEGFQKYGDRPPHTLNWFTIEPIP